MSTNCYNVLGVMSGTSLDGIDLAYISFEMKKEWSYKSKIVDTIKYNEYWLEKLSKLSHKNKDELIILDREYTRYLSEQLNTFIDQNEITDLDFISSHGHTALHQPESGITYQIGNREELAQLTNKIVVCDFRVQDVMYGGQGAPLVPIGDKLLFKEFDFCLNLGGFANISLEVNNLRIAYDICPVNVVLNYYAKVLGYEFDKNGELAEEGCVNLELLNKLSRLPYYSEKPPKSLGIEWVNKLVFPIINGANDNPKNILRTYCEHVAIQISNAINKKSNVKVLVTGGGTYNKFLIQRIKKLSNAEIVIPQGELIEFKEAIIFGLLGVLKIRNEVNCLRSVTGAKIDHSSGVIFEPKKTIIST
jgi:anhydro-N-acetylmuramic acid kinase